MSAFYDQTSCEKDYTFPSASQIEAERLESPPERPESPPKRPESPPPPPYSPRSPSSAMSALSICSSSSAVSSLDPATVPLNFPSIQELNKLPNGSVSLTDIHSSIVATVARAEASLPKAPLTIDEIYGKLLSYQVALVKSLSNTLTQFGTALDGSDTGVGKTYSAVAIAAILGLGIFVICPKAVISSWNKVCKIFGVKIYGVINYESIKGGRYYDPQSGQKVKCPYIDTTGDNYKWSLPSDTLLIFDEVHKCKNIASLNGKLLTTSKDSKVKILMLSATVADRPQFFANCAYILDICESPRIFDIFVRMLQKMNPGQSPMNILHRKIFPQRGARIRIADLGDLFPKNQVIAETYTMGADIEKQIQEQYMLLSTVVEERKRQEMESSIYLVTIIRIRQKIEALRVPSLIEQAEDLLENDFSVVIFTNFVDTLKLLADKLKTECIVCGGQSMAVRDKCIEDFQTNKSRIIICQIQSGGVGISLHDLVGPCEGHPHGFRRASLINPTWSAGDLVQALGRIYRANGKSPCLQRIFFCANTVEEEIAANLQIKLNNYAQINDGKDQSNINLEKP
jgi:SNF2 family DNA or RNA helicase